MKYLEEQLIIADKDTATLKAWVTDLQSMADVLKKHIEACPKHPMSDLTKELCQLRKAAEQVREEYNMLAGYVSKAWDIMGGAGDFDSIYSDVYLALENANAFLNNPKQENQ
ncbi:hypothetical protein HYS94_01655 [Candidatus Daviesbacteria bacterium]|nr:hypothetical protein [Candidatus Daviesbacteria bacterium]